MRRIAMVGIVLSACTTGIPGETGAPPDSGGGSSSTDDLNSVEDPLDPLFGFSTGTVQLAKLCARGNHDAVSTAFCTGSPPALTSLTDLQQLVGLSFNGMQTPSFVFTGHSTSLVTKSVSAINPRAIIFTTPKSIGRVAVPQPLASFVAMGFVRGEQFVELVSNDPSTGDLRFFLLRFTQACNASGCTTDDLLTPKIESGFTGYTLYEDVDLANTVLDCNQCHQPGGPSTKKMLRMQELQIPWGHFMTQLTPNGSDLMNDFIGAHGNETYAGIPGSQINGADPLQMEGFVENQGFQAQPNEFDSAGILDRGRSAEWMSVFTQGEQAKALPAPYHENRVTDPALLASATAAYKTSQTAHTPLTTDLRAVFDPNALADLGFVPDPSLVQAGNGRAILVQMCQQCHNSSLDQTLTRARFDVTKLESLSAAEKAKAIERLNLPATAARKMPPERFRTLSPAEIAIVTQALSN
ncbi:MAG: hypothetical protein QM831_35675 [Kofleriaceae bacterium]